MGNQEERKRMQHQELGAPHIQQQKEEETGNIRPGRMSKEVEEKRGEEVGDPPMDDTVPRERGSRSRAMGASWGERLGTFH